MTKMTLAGMAALHSRKLTIFSHLKCKEIDLSGGKDSLWQAKHSSSSDFGTSEPTVLISRQAQVQPLNWIRYWE